MEIKSKQCCAVCKLRFQTEVAKLLREYCYKGDPKVIAFTVIIQLTFLRVYRFPSILDSVFYLFLLENILWGEKTASVESFLGNKINGNAFLLTLEFTKVQRGLCVYMNIPSLCLVSVFRHKIASSSKTHLAYALLFSIYFFVFS